MFAHVITDKQSYVKKYDGKEYIPNKGEHISGVFNDLVGACNTARKVARQNDLEYVSLDKANEK